jgi:hypothetical protein
MNVTVVHKCPRLAALGKMDRSLLIIPILGAQLRVRLKI